VRWRWGPHVPGCYIEVMEEERRSTSVRLKVSTLEWLKIEALRRRTSMADVLERCVDAERERERAV